MSATAGPTHPTSTELLIRHEESAPRERSTCGWRHLLVSRQDSNVAAWAHAVDIDGARQHYHRVATELYYVLEGEGTVLLDGVEHAVRKGTLVHIPPGVVHGAKGRMRVLVVGIPDISDGDLYFPEEHGPPVKKGRSAEDGGPRREPNPKSADEGDAGGLAHLDDASAHG